jgi:hypothetical protein
MHAPVTTGFAAFSIWQWRVELTAQDFKISSILTHLPCPAGSSMIYNNGYSANIYVQTARDCRYVLLPSSSSAGANILPFPSSSRYRGSGTQVPITTFFVFTDASHLDPCVELPRFCPRFLGPSETSVAYRGEEIQGPLAHEISARADAGRSIRHGSQTKN